SKSAERWLLRFKGRDGEWKQFRTTTKRIADFLRDGRLPVDTEVTKPDEGEFRPVREIAEFRGVKCRRSGKRKRKIADPSKNGRKLPEEVRARQRSRWRTLAGAVTAAILVAAAAAVLYLVLHGMS